MSERHLLNRHRKNLKSHISIEFFLGIRQFIQTNEEVIQPELLSNSPRPIPSQTPSFPLEPSTVVDLPSSCLLTLTDQGVNFSLLGWAGGPLEMRVPEDRCVRRRQQVNHDGGCRRLVVIVVILGARCTEVFSSLWRCILVMVQSPARLLQNSKWFLHLPSVFKYRQTVPDQGHQTLTGYIECF